MQPIITNKIPSANNIKTKSHKITVSCIDALAKQSTTKFTIGKKKKNHTEEYLYVVTLDR